MEINKVIDQLENLRCHCRDFQSDDVDIWDKDIEALTIAIETVKKYYNL